MQNIILKLDQRRIKSSDDDLQKTKIFACYLGENIDSFLGYIFYWALGWYGTEIFALVITTNRLAAIIFNSLYKQYFGIKSARIICLATFVSALILVTPNCAMFGFHYVPRYKVSLTIRPKSPSAYLNLFTQFDTILTYTISIYVLMAYLIMCCYLYKNYRQLKTINPGYKKEVYNGALNRLGNIFYVGLNPIFCLILDSTLRQEVCSILKLKKDNHIYPIV
uniref:7TM GPCR serpentine receptor class x (Srx) domain-containing protein n=1 Tax=Romanomermis culicivorax TaxID=13658 RepID=A0A915I8R9_ROMCU